MAKFPWSELQPGQGFFVPCLDVAKVMQRGLTAAMHVGVNGRAYPAIYKKKLGVWFFIWHR